MKMVMVICPEGRDGDVRALIQQHAVHAFTQIRDALGEGETGRHLGTTVWPGRVSVLFSVVADERVAELTAALKACAKSLLPGEGLRAFVMPVESMI